MAAMGRPTSPPAQGAYFCKMCARMDKPKAVTAGAHMPVRLIYSMHTKGEEYSDPGQDYDEERYRERALWRLARRAERMDVNLMPGEPVTS